jgi:hypothetical protein
MSVLGHSKNVLKSLPGGPKNNSHPLVITELQCTIMPSTVNQQGAGDSFEHILIMSWCL